MRMLVSVAVTLALALPVLAMAQNTNDDQLRAQIHADLLQDPRASQLSQVELQALVDSLASKATADGTAGDYLASKNTFDYSKLFPEPKKPSTLSRVLTLPMLFALALLLMLLLAVTLYIIRRKGVPLEASSNTA